MVFVPRIDEAAILRFCKWNADQNIKKTLAEKKIFDLALHYLGIVSYDDIFQTSLGTYIY